MKKQLYFLFLFLSCVYSAKLSAQCGAGTSNGALSAPTASWQNTASVGSGTRPYWSFTATAGDVFSFSDCSGSEDSYMYIYSTTWVVQTFNDDNGPHCATSRASLDWTCTVTGTYYVFLAKYPCATLTSNHALAYTYVCAEPATQASSFSSSAIATTTMTVGWTRGTGNNVLVIAKAGSAPSDPTSGVAYTGNAAYGSGTSVGGGFAVYNGSGTSVNLTALTSNTTYYYAIYEYATTGTCYKLAELTGNATTSSCTEPTIQATSFSSSAIATTTMTAGWTRGNGNNVLVIAKAGSAPSDPTSGVSYSANAAYGSGDAVGGGFAVYNGTGTSVNLTALTSNTTYYYAIYEYATTGTCYKLVELTGNATTASCTEPTTQASAFSSGSITFSTMTVGWTRGNGNNVLVIAKAGSAPSDPTSGVSYSANAAYGSGDVVGGGFAVYNGTGTSVNLTALSSSTTYYYAIYEYATTGTCYKLVELTGNATTSACTEPTTQASSFSSGAITFSTMTASWTRGNGNNVLVIAKAGSAPSDPTSGVSYSANAAYGSGGAVGGGFAVYNGTGTSVSLTSLSSSTTYYYAIYEYATSGTCYKLVELTGNATTSVAPCTEPTTQATSFASSSVTTTTMTIDWTRGDGDNVLVVAKAGSAPSDPTLGFSYTGNSVYGSGTSVGGGYAIYNGSGTSVNLTGLTAGTTYYYAIYEYATTGTCYKLAELTGSATTSAPPAGSSILNAGFNTDGTAANASAMLDISSTNKGLLIPRVALTGTGDVTTIASATTSLLIYNTATVSDVTPGYYYWSGAVWVRLMSTNPASTNWNLLGNSGTVAATNYIGTSDNIDLRFRTNNIDRMQIKAHTLEFLNNGNSVYLGEGAGQSATSSATSNVAIGYQAMSAGTSPLTSVGIGYQALRSWNESTAGFAIAIGQYTQYNNISGDESYTLGAYSLYNKSTGTLFSSSSQAAIGDSALFSYTSGNTNVAIGHGAMRDGTGSNTSIAVGQNALKNSSSSGNIAVGINAGALNTSGGTNISIGNYAALSSTTSSNTIAIGYQAGYTSNTGNNTLIGYQAGRLITGSGNVCVGYQAGSAETGSNKLYIDNSNTSTPLLYGDFSTDMVGINRVPTTNTLEISALSSKTAAGAWLANSDKRIKTNIQTVENAIETIMKLHPVKFKYTEEWKNRVPYIKANDRYYYNFIAQEYQQVFPESVKGSGEFLQGDSTEILQLDTYNSQIVAIQAIKEQQKILAELSAISTNQEKMIARQTKTINVQQNNINTIKKALAAFNLQSESKQK